MTWKTKKEALSYLQKLKNSAKLNTPFSDAEHMILLDMVKRHFDYVNLVGDSNNKRILQFITENNGLANSIHFSIVFNDGLILPISYTECLNGDKTQNTKFSLADRTAVAPDMIEAKNKLFADGKHPLSVISRRILEYEDTHMDHIEPFANIIKEFIAENYLDVNAVEIKKTDGKYLGGYFTAYLG